VANSEDRIRGLVGDLAYKAPVRMASTANLTLYGLQTIDAVVGVDNDRVLLKNQTATVENGFYSMGAGNWVRAADFDGAQDVLQYTRVDVVAGTINGGKTFRLTTANPVIGVSGLVFAEVVSGAVLQFSDEGVPIGAAGSASALNFTGGGITASQVGAAVTVTVPGVQFLDEGASLGAPGSAATVNFAGAGVAASQVGGAVTVAIPSLQFLDEGASLGAAGSAATVNFTGTGATASQVGGAVVVNIPEGTVQTISTGSWNLSLGNVTTLNLTSNITMAAPTNIAPGAYALIINQDATGSRLITWDPIFDWPGGTAPVLSTAGLSRDIISFVSDGTRMYGVAQRAFA